MHYSKVISMVLMGVAVSQTMAAPGFVNNLEKRQVRGSRRGTRGRRTVTGGARRASGRSRRIVSAVVSDETTSDFITDVASDVISSDESTVDETTVDETTVDENTEDGAEESNSTRRGRQGLRGNTRSAEVMAEEALEQIDEGGRGDAAQDEDTGLHITGEDLEFLQSHNNERAAYGMHPLAWNDALAEQAYWYGQELAGIGCALIHSGERYQGENLYASWGGANAASRGVQMWNDEPLDHLNHHTQVLWHSTTEVGCANIMAGCQIVVCRYTPAGNVLGQHWSG